jgi:hypothetical protein
LTNGKGVEKAMEKAMVKIHLELVARGLTK